MRSILKKNKGITLIALVITIIIIIILSAVSIQFTIGENGIITKAEIAKNENEVSTIKESLNIYYLEKELEQKDEEPISNKVLKESIKDKNTLETIVQYQNTAESIEQINYNSLYYLDLEKLGLNGIEKNKYFMDIETRIIYINEGIKLNKGKIYILEEKEILPIELSTEETEKGFKLIARLAEDSKEVKLYNFYIDNVLYKTEMTNARSAEIEVNDKEFGEYKCRVKAIITDGMQYLSNDIVAQNYIIKKASDFDLLRSKIAEGNSFEEKKVRVINDIDLSGNETTRNWIPIGNEINKFKGIFEGNNHKILNMYNKNITDINQGLFANTENAIIQNITIQSGELKADNYVGAITGQAKNTKIINCHNKMNIIAVKGNAGGIVGSAVDEGKIENCTNTGNINSTEYVDDDKNTWIGGIVGKSYVHISNCTNTANIGSVYGASGGISRRKFLSRY